MQPSKAPCPPRHAPPRHWQSVGLFTWMACPCHFRCVPPRFGSCPCVRLHRLASDPLSCVLQSVHGPAPTRALVRHRLGKRRGWPRVHHFNQPSTVPPDQKSKSQPLCQKSPRLPSIQDSLSSLRKPKQANHQHHASQFFGVPAFCSPHKRQAPGGQTRDSRASKTTIADSL
jgi:hypothetical protein